MNVALPRDFEWMTKKEKQKNRKKTGFRTGSTNLLDDDVLINVPLSQQEIESNAKYFIHFMAHKMEGVGRYSE